MSDSGEELVKITSGGTISIPKQFRRYLEMQKGDYVNCNNYNKKLSDLFIDNKISNFNKKIYPIIRDEKNNILWI